MSDGPTRPDAARRLVRSLVESGEFGHVTQSVRVVETHISWILLTGEFAYKIKKPVAPGFLDFTTLDARRRYCLLELELNRRYAPDIYLDVVSIGGRPDRPEIGAEPALEWAVRMRQFADDARLDRQIELGQASVDELWEFGETLARLHQESEKPAADDPCATPAAIARPVRDNFTALGNLCDDAGLRTRLDALAAWCESELVRLTPLFAQRGSGGRIRECHGDLHLENLVRLEGRIVPFDCLEFDPALRRIDVISEVAFLLMDTLRIGHADLGYAFLNRYLEVSGDYPGIALLPFYCVYRALVRAKVAALRAGPGGNRAMTDYIELASHLADRERRPWLIACRGLSGTGKTHLSRLLLPVLPAIRIRTDLIRKRLHHLDELALSGSGIGRGLYADDVSGKTYATLAAHARTALSAGFNVIADATFLRRRDRDTLREAAAGCLARFAILECTAEDRVLAERIEKREAAGGDASEANLGVLDWQREHADALDGEERRHALTVDTGRHLSISDIVRELHDIALTPLDGADKANG